MHGHNEGHIAPLQATRNTHHRENMPTWLPWPVLSCSTAQFPPNAGTLTNRWTRRRQKMHFMVTLLIMVIEIRFNFQIYVQCAESMCNVPKKPFLKSLSISNEILSKFNIRGTPDYQRITSKGSRTMGSECQHDKTGFGSVRRGGGKIFHVVILPCLTLWALGWFE